MPPEEGAHRRHGSAHRRGRIVVHLLQVEQVRAHLRLVEAGRIAAVPRRQLADEAQILVLGRPRERVQLQRFRETDQGLAIRNTNSTCAALAGRRVRGYLTGGFGYSHATQPAPSSPSIPPPSCHSHSPAPRQRLGSTEHHRQRQGCAPSCLTADVRRKNLNECLFDIENMWPSRWGEPALSVSSPR
jgi:hypothetical protein